MKEAKDKVAEKFMEASKNNKTNPWEMADLEIVLKISRTISPETPWADK